jgi:hypothetical protein
MTVWVLYTTTTGAIKLCTTVDVDLQPDEAALGISEMISPAKWRVDLNTLELVAVPEPVPDPAIALRRERDRLLLASDWTRLDDTDLTNEQREEAKVYRAALRIAPETGSLPTPPAWLFPSLT